MFGFVYIWFDRKNKRYYIGSHKGNPEDGYISSSSWMKNAYYRRPEDFKRKILSIRGNRRELLEEEQKWLDLIDDKELGKKYYNLKKKAYGGFSRCAIEKSAELRRGIPLTDEMKKKKSIALLGKPWSQKRKLAKSGNYKKTLYYEHHGKIIGHIKDAVIYSGKCSRTIHRWCNKNFDGWKKYRMEKI